MAERITVKRASELMGMAPETVRYCMEKKTIDIGTVIRTSRKRANYYIVPAKLAAYLGLPVEKVKEDDQ